jgi:hypothetical protein
VYILADAGIDATYSVFLFLVETLEEKHERMMPKHLQFVTKVPNLVGILMRVREK